MPLARLGIVAFVSLVLACSAAFARTVSIISGPGLGPPARHGLAKFEEALRAQGWEIDRATSTEAARGEQLVFASLTPSAPLMAVLPYWPDVAEGLVVRHFSLKGKPAVLFAGADDRGLMYALQDAAGRLADAPAVATLANLIPDVSEQPVVRDRSLSVYVMNRAHWEGRFYDERYWIRYFDLLAASRFNRFLIIFGYENGGFLAPPYPYFFDTPGFPEVHMIGLDHEQQARNLTALNHLIELAHARGIAVSLGIWDHIYRAGVQTGGAEWIGEYQGRPVPNTVAGVTTANLNDYTRASLGELLARVPAVDGLQLRIHEESGLTRAEMDVFWREVFQHIQRIRPGLYVELRGKGTPDSVIDTAVSLGLNFRIETKYWMEQMGLPFHPTHVNPPDQQNRRHGYADFLKYPQRYQMTWRLWNGGTSRILLWGDPDYVRRYVATTALYASPNLDIQEPLATKMEAQRPDLPDFDLMPAPYRYYDYEFERYWNFFQLWGRLSYNPATPPALWDREYQRRFGAAGPHLEAALQQASRVLPMIVSAVYPYSRFPTTRGWAERQTLGATLENYARNEGTDTELFENFADAAKRIAAAGATAKRTPAATSRWFDTTADAIIAAVHEAEASVGTKRGNEFDATVTDLKILAQLARFHARRSLAAVHYNLFLLTKEKSELSAAAQGEKAAMAAWRELVAAAGDRYAPDLAMGAREYELCGHWRDELPRLEAGVKALEARVAETPDQATSMPAWLPASDVDRPGPVVEQQRIASAPAGHPLSIVARATSPAGIQSLRLRFRHVSQFEDYATLEMHSTGRTDEYAATIPADFLESKWDVMYFIEAIDRAGSGSRWPDFTREPPYVFVHLQR